MKVLARILICLLLASTPAFASIASVYYSTIQHSSDGITASVTGVTTTGATVLVCAYAYNSTSGTPTCSDNKSNTYVTGTARCNGVECVNFAYVCTPTVGTSHNISVTDGSHTTVPSFIFWALSGSNPTTCKDKDSAGGTVTGGMSVQPGSITPDFNNEIVMVVAGHVSSPDCTPSTDCINGGFTGEKYDGDANAEGMIFGYLGQTSAAAANPTINWATNANVAAYSMSFREAAAVATSPTPRRRR